MIKPTVWLVWLAAMSIANWCSAEAAKSAPTVVLVVEGATPELRGDVADSLMRELIIQAPDDLMAAVASQGMARPFAEPLADPRTRRQTLSVVRKAMKQVRADAVLSVQAKRGKAGARSMRVTLFVSTQVEPIVEEDITLYRHEKVVAKLAPLLAVSLQDLLSAPRPPSDKEGPVATTAAKTAPLPVRKPPNGVNVAEEAVEKKAARAPKQKDNVEVREPDERVAVAASERDAVVPKRAAIHQGIATVVGDVEMGVARRDLQYTDAIAGPLRNYTAPAIAVYGAGIQLYPAAPTGIAVAKDIGFVARYANSLDVESKTADGASAARGSFRRYAVGVRGRILAGGKKESPLIGVEGTYGVSTFAFSGSDSVINDVLTVEYKYLRAGVDARIPWGDFSLLGGAGYMNISSAGPFSERFPRAVIAGVEGMLGGSYSIASRIDIRAVASYTRIFSSANPTNDAPYAAGGALDQYVAVHLGASTIF